MGAEKQLLANLFAVISLPDKIEDLIFAVGKNTACLNEFPVRNPEICAVLTRIKMIPMLNGTKPTYITCNKE